MLASTAGTETIRYRGPNTWDLVPSDIKNAQSLVELKNGNHKDVHADCVSIMFNTMVSFKIL